MLRRRPLYRSGAEKPTMKAEANGDPWGRTQKVHVLRASWVTGLERSAIQAGMSLMGQKMCPRCELGLLPLRPQTSIKYLFTLATWRRQGREWDRRDAATLASINFSNLSDNIKASRFIFQRRLITILMPLQSHIKEEPFQQPTSPQRTHSSVISLKCLHIRKQVLMIPGA